eukprot:snap_masked-scaffold_28-processed-gene-2.13-mRNA-1 protein AED:1.00 eAED:1.00 QI:0/0/0/0/1/1/3/0/64
MKITKICPCGAAFIMREVISVQTSSKSSESLFINDRKYQIAAKNPCEEDGSGMWTLCFESLKHE